MATREHGRTVPTALPSVDGALLATSVALALAAGAVARFDGLLVQTPFDDEWHPLLAVKWWGAAKIFLAFGWADHSIPVTLYLELLSRFDRLTPATLWWPFAAAGLLMPALIARAAAPTFERLAGWLFAALLWLSPLFVYLSRLARPYVFTAPACLLLVLWLCRARDEPSLPRMLGWWGLAVGVGWASPVYLPFLAVALAAYCLVPLRGSAHGGSRDRFRRWALALATAAGWLALLLPPTVADLENLARKVNARPAGLDDLYRAAMLFPGTGSVIVLAIVLGLACVGAGRAPRPKRRAAALLGAGMAAQVLVFLLSNPKGAGSPFVASRYLLPVLLVFVLLACQGLVRSVVHLPRAGLLAALVLAGAGLFLSRPLWPLLEGRTDNFRSTLLYHLVTRVSPTVRLDSTPLPPIYDQILDAAAGTAILEAPYNGYLRLPYAFYQRRHGKPVLLGVERGFCVDTDTRELPPDGQGGFRLGRFVSLGDFAQMRRKGVRFILLHENPEVEVAALADGLARVPRFDYTGCLARLSEALGQPPEIREGIALFDLSRSTR